jgi:TPR repeat protein
MKKFWNMFTILIVISIDIGAFEHREKLLNLCSDGIGRANASYCNSKGEEFMLTDSLFSEMKQREYNLTTAIMFFEMACEKGNRRGCNHLGVHYALGLGIKQDYSKSIEYYHRACGSISGKGAMSASCKNLAIHYEKGEGVIQDSVKAFNYYKKACHNIYPTGCYKLGEYYEKGLGVEQNKTLAEKVYKNVCPKVDIEECKPFKVGLREDIRMHGGGVWP